MAKRSSDQFLAMDAHEADLQIENMPMTESCDVIRRKVRTLIDNNEMKVGEFQKEINITANAYSRFMSQHGTYKGAESSVYPAAWAFFKKREIQGIKTTPNKKSKKDAKGQDGKDSVPSVDDVELDGEKEDMVEIFDTCDDVRKKINTHLQKPGVTQASFLRAASACYHTQPKKLTSSQLSAFRSKKGSYEGNTSGIFYGAYVYFEKLRIKEGKPKSKKRQEMEEIHATGLKTERRFDRIICRADERWRLDGCARLIISGPSGERICA